MIYCVLDKLFHQELFNTKSLAPRFTNTKYIEYWKSIQDFTIFHCWFIHLYLSPTVEDRGGPRQGAGRQVCEVHAAGQAATEAPTHQGRPHTCMHTHTHTHTYTHTHTHTFTVIYTHTHTHTHTHTNICFDENGCS